MEQSRERQVVICFQILFFIFTNTIYQSECSFVWTLWFAFKFCSLFLQTQFESEEAAKILGCDLLSNFVLYFYKHNPITVEQLLPLVVICFQILFFIFTNTIWSDYWQLAFRLWFAFKFCSLFLQTQSTLLTRLRSSGCDLLSNFVLYFYKHNISSPLRYWMMVVICFQILFFIFTNTILLFGE